MLFIFFTVESHFYIYLSQILLILKKRKQEKWKLCNMGNPTYFLKWTYCLLELSSVKQEYVLHGVIVKFKWDNIEYTQWMLLPSWIILLINVTVCLQAKASSLTSNTLENLVSMKFSASSLATLCHDSSVCFSCVACLCSKHTADFDFALTVLITYKVLFIAYCTHHTCILQASRHRIMYLIL